MMDTADLARRIRLGEDSTLAGLGVLTRSRATPVPNGPTLSGRRLWGTLLSSNPNSLEWTQIDRPRVPQVCVSIVSVE